MELLFIFTSVHTPLFFIQVPSSFYIVLTSLPEVHTNNTQL